MKSSCPSLEVCKICILNIYFAMISCIGEENPSDIVNCIIPNLYEHCKPCLCWAVCQFGLENVCNWCLNVSRDEDLVKEEKLYVIV